MIYVAIAETDCDYMEYLKKLLLQWADKKTEVKISVFLNGKALAGHLPYVYDIVFVDLSPDQPDGILAVRKLRDMGYQNLLILIADSVSRACEGYRVNAYRYYVKPVRGEDIRECMDYALVQKNRKYFQYTYHGVTKRIEFDSIICFEIIDHYIDIYTTNSTVHIKGALKEVQEQCPSYFHRCHRSCIVNMERVLVKSGRQLKLENGKTVDISPRYLEAVTNAMEQLADE